MEENGFDLWQALLKYTDTATDDLMALAPLSVAVMSSDNSQTLETILRIVESYCFLSPSTFIPPHATHIFTQFAGLLRTLSEAATKPILHTVDLILQLSDVAVWAPAAEQSGLFEGIIKAVQTDVRPFFCSRGHTPRTRV